MDGASRSVFGRIRSRIPVVKLSDAPTVPSSPVPHLLNENKVPTEEERKILRDAIADTEVRIIRLVELEVAQGPPGDSDKFNLTRSRIIRRRRACEAFVKTHKSLLVPVRDLPTELLQEIFLHYAYSPTKYHRWVTLPFVLGQICSSWRKVAVNLPALWDKLPCFKIKRVITRRMSYLAFVRELLRRSGESATLQVYIYAPFKEFKTHPLIDVLVTHSERFKTLTIESTSTTMTAFKGAKGRLTNLQRLDLYFWSHSVIQPAEDMDVFETAPKLKNVSLYGKVPDAIALPWSQLTVFREKYDGASAAKVLQHASGLQTLEIVKNNHHASPVPVPTTLSALKNVRIRIDDVSPEADVFLSTLVAPAIDNLKIVYPESLVQHLTSSFTTAAAQALDTGTLGITNHLRSLAFRTMSISPDELRAMLRLVPWLKELDMEVSDGDDAFLHVFILPDTAVASVPIEPVAPLLETLSITAKTITGLEGTFNDIARTRCENATEPEGDADGIILSGSAFRPLRTLRLNLAGREHRYNSQAALNKWKAPASKVQFREVALLNAWRRQLLDELPEVFVEPFVKPKMTPNLEKDKSKEKERLAKGKKLMRIFNDIELYQLQDAIPIRSSKLHLTLSYIALRATPIRLPNYPRTTVEVAQRILDNQFKPILTSCLDEYKWVTKGTTSLVYVPSHADIRKSDNAVQDLVYELKDEMEVADVWWPQYL
ncbi:hypothetical protein NLJ89_g1295 [Agrocybe chaxingu]|uniref:F-box domain-containing protein n=1 Tax=Agrocybe chaxingu TaxID=84603 RepID=A0A9W8N0B8_9AGAR|nr:hypothetical protein NLJ89_g1295 [Agrocybe chaxingu]